MVKRCCLGGAQTFFVPPPSTNALVRPFLEIFVDFAFHFTYHIYLNTITFRCSKDKQIYPETMFRRGRMSRNRIINSETRKTLLREISPSLPLTLRIKNGDKMQNIKVNLTLTKYLLWKKDLKMNMKFCVQVPTDQLEKNKKYMISFSFKPSPEQIQTF